MTAQPTSPKSPNGETDVKDLHITWAQAGFEGGYPVLSCTVALGSVSCPIRLDHQAPRKEFSLISGTGRAAWGVLALDQASGRGCALTLSWALAPLQSDTPLPAPLVKWFLCPEQRSSAPKTGSSRFGPEKSITAAWQIDGSQSDCQNVSIAFSINDQPLASASLSESRKNRQRTLVSGDIFAHCTLEYIIAAGDEIHLMLDCRYARSPVTTQTLETWEQPPVPAPPVPGPRTPETPVIGERRPKEELAAIVRPAGLVPPTPGQKQRRFVAMKNRSAFQMALAQEKTAADQLAQALDFMNPETRTYPGQYLSDIGDLPAPMGNLQGEAMTRLWQLKTEPDAFMDGLTTLLGCSVQNFLSNKGYAPAKMRVQDSSLALILSRSPKALHQDALIRFLVLCHVCEYLKEANPPAPRALSELMDASCRIPATVRTPEANSAAQSGSDYVRPLGVAKLQTLAHSLSRYEPGELAHVENVMQGENREQELSRVLSQDSLATEGEKDDLSKDRKLRQQGVSQAYHRSHADPSLALTREFNKLNNQYGSDGLSDTVTGGWTDSAETKSPESLAARHRTRDLLDRAASQVSRKIRSQRQKQIRDSLRARHLCRYTNEAGQTHLIGIYRWVDQVFSAQLTSEGRHLFLEFILARPAENLICRESTLRGRDLSIPQAPAVKTPEGTKPLTPGDVTRATYLALAAQYGLKEVPPAPPATRTVSATLCADPPSSTAAVGIPRGYFPQKARISYAISAPAQAPAASKDTALTLVILVGSRQTCLKIPPDAAWGDVSVSLAQPEDPAAEECPDNPPGTAPQIRTARIPVAALAPPDCRYAINVLIQCACPDQGALYRHWQRDTCRLIQEGYQRLKASRIHQLKACFAGAQSLGRPSTVVRDTLKTRAIDCLIHHIRPEAAKKESPRDADLIYFRLIPFFSRALAWADMSHTYFPVFFGPDAENRPYMAALGPDGAPGDDLGVFFQAGAVRLLVPVRRAYALGILYFLSSRGNFWSGTASLTPVFETDLDLVNQFKSIPASALQEPASWEFRVATDMLWLQPESHLPHLNSGSGTGEGRS